MASIESVTLEVADPSAVNRFYTAAFGLGTQVRLRAAESPATGYPDGFAWGTASP